MEAINRLSPRGKVILAISSFILVIIIVSVVLYLNSRHTVTIITDTTPITVELDDTKHVLDSKSTTLTLDSAAYNYRVSSSQRPTIAGTFDLTETKNKTVVIKYKVYEQSYIKKEACKRDPAYCPLDPQAVTVSFFEDYSWAIIRTETIESGLIMSINSSGEWELEGYTGEVGRIVGTYPEAVEKEVYDDEE